MTVTRDMKAVPTRVEAVDSPALIKKNAYEARQKGQLHIMQEQYMKLLNHPDSCLNDKLKAVHELTRVYLYGDDFYKALKIMKNGLEQTGSTRILRSMVHFLIDQGYYDLAREEIRKFQPKTKVQECICRDVEATLLLIETKTKINKGQEVDVATNIALIRRLYANNLIDGYNVEGTRELYFKAGSWFGEPLKASTRSFIEESLVAHPGSSFFNFKKAEILIREASSTKEYKEALSYANKAICKNPKEPSLQLMVSHIYYKLEKMSECKAAFEKAIKYTRNFCEFETDDFDLIRDFYHYAEDVRQMKVYGLLAKSPQMKEAGNKAACLAESIFLALSSKLPKLAMKIMKYLASLEAKDMPIEAHEAILATSLLAKNPAYEKTACHHIIANSGSVDEGLKKIERIRSIVEGLKGVKDRRGNVPVCS